MSALNQGFHQHLLATKRNEDSDSGGGSSGDLAGSSSHGSANGFSNPVFEEGKISVLGANHEDMIMAASGNLCKSFGTLTGSVDIDLGSPFEHLITGSTKGLENLQLHEISSGEDLGMGAKVNLANRAFGMGITQGARS